MKKIRNNLFTILIGIVFIFNLYSFIRVKIFKDDIAPVLGYAVLNVVSDSMNPTIKKGDLVVIKTKCKVLNKDIITFYDKNNNLVTHRIVKMDDEVITTKGDNNDSEDEEIDTSRIVGKYMFKIPGMGLVLDFLRNPVVMILIFIVGVVVIWGVNKNIILKEEYQEYLKKKEEEKKKNAKARRKKKKGKKKKKKRKR